MRQTLCLIRKWRLIRAEYSEFARQSLQDPAFGLEAVWIDRVQRDHAQTLGYTVVDPSTVVATHLSHILQSNAHELFGYEEAQRLLDNLSQLAPKLVEDLVPKTLPLGVVVKVLQNLLLEKISIRDMRSIAETLAEYGVKSQDPDILTSAVRAALGRAIVHDISGVQMEIPVITLDSGLEQILHRSLQTASDGGAGLEPGLAEQMHKSLEESTQKMEMNGQAAGIVGVCFYSALVGALRPFFNSRFTCAGL